MNCGDPEGYHVDQKCLVRVIDKPGWFVPERAQPGFHFNGYVYSGLPGEEDAMIGNKDAYDRRRHTKRKRI